jgi:hypothetical protein
MMMKENWYHRHHCIPSCEASAVKIEIAWYKQIYDIAASLKRNFLLTCLCHRFNEFSPQVTMNLFAHLLDKVSIRRFLCIKNMSIISIGWQISN